MALRTMALHTMAHVSRDDVLSTVHLSQVRHQLAAHLVRVRVRVGVRVRVRVTSVAGASLARCPPGAWYGMAFARHTHGIRMAMRIVYAWYMQSMATDAAHLAARARDEEDLGRVRVRARFKG